MSLPTLHGTVLLTTDPRTGETRSGDPYTSALGRFQTWRKTDAGWEEGDSHAANLIAFGDAARDLAAFAKGDRVELKGTVTPAVWKDTPQLKVTVTACRVPVKQTRQLEAAA